MQYNLYRNAVYNIKNAIVFVIQSTNNEANVIVFRIPELATL
jgi:hypothetical protein